MLLSLISNIGFLASAWYGGHMVYTHGMRVQAAGSPQRVPEIKPPGDAQLEQAMLSLAQERRHIPPHAWTRTGNTLQFASATQRCGLARCNIHIPGDA